ncbi:MAG: DNA gyrase inhibitor YacG [Planctomycetaceae bacterium]|nr:DNA gyrase inhibitor YacG [Planctomycetaceae bacterium]
MATREGEAATHEDEVATHEDEVATRLAGTWPMIFQWGSVGHKGERSRRGRRRSGGCPHKTREDRGVDQMQSEPWETHEKAPWDTHEKTPWVTHEKTPWETHEKSLTCSVCEQHFAENNDGVAMPFCSQRCKMIDAARWLDERYGMPVEKPSEDDLTAAE